MKRSFIKAAVTIVSVLAFVLVRALYDSEKLTEPIIGYSEAVTQIPLDSMWEETAQTEETTQTPKTQTITTVSTLDNTSRISEPTETVTTEPQTYTSEISEISDVSPKAEQKELININTATAEELKQLNGIGDVIAARIVEYAQTIGFNSIEDIKNVKGIGDKKFDNIKDKITV